MSLQNPFKNTLAIDNSNYNSFDGVHLISDKGDVCRKTQEVHNSFRSFILSRNFSCILGKAAVQTKSYRFGFYNDMSSEGTLSGVAYDLYKFIQERPSFGDRNSTFIVCFENPQIESEEHFEKVMWSFLDGLQIKDQEYHIYDSAVSSNPEDDHYAYSFGELAFFIVGLHPKSSRHTRKFSYPTIVFNPHIQFRHLRKTQKFSKYQKIIRNNEINLQGSINPNLANFGERSEARQYSGRKVEENWVCPFAKK